MSITEIIKSLENLAGRSFDALIRITCTKTETKTKGINKYGKPLKKYFSAKKTKITPDKNIRTKVKINNLEMKLLILLSIFRGSE